MNKKCLNCQMVNFVTAERCARCDAELTAGAALPTKSAFPWSKIFRSVIFRRAAVCLAVCVLAVMAFYFSLVLSAKALNAEEKKSVDKAIQMLSKKGFSGEVALLKYMTVYRGNDNWLNASVIKENAYAATNFPFEIMTIYPEFFTYPQDDIERAAILLHEAQHLKGADEAEAYEYVWKNRKLLGWTRGSYNGSVLWQNVRQQTREYAPHLFVCETNHYKDCTEQ